MLRLSFQAGPETKSTELTEQDTGFHAHRLARRLQDPELRAEFDRQRREIAAIDAVVNQIDALREEQRLSKADLARAIDKNPAAVRRLLTASGNPALRTVIAMAEALGAEVQLVAKPAASTRVTSARCRARAAAASGETL
jgi:DNA-binding phage protein